MDKGEDKNKRIYGFKILDNDYNEFKGFMVYTIKDNLLTPAIKDFENAWEELFSFNSMIKCLNYNNVKELFTYTPNDDETICSAPYETEENEEEYDNDYRFHHFEISPTKEQKRELKENNIKLTSLNDEEINSLEKRLRHHY